MGKIDFFYFAGIIAAFDLKAARRIQLNEYMKLHECQGYYLTLAKGYSEFQN